MGAWKPLKTWMLEKEIWKVKTNKHVLGAVCLLSSLKQTKNEIGDLHNCSLIKTGLHYFFVYMYTHTVHTERDCVCACGCVCVGVCELCLCGSYICKLFDSTSNRRKLHTHEAVLYDITMVTALTWGFLWLTHFHLHFGVGLDVHSCTVEGLTHSVCVILWN